MEDKGKCYKLKKKWEVVCGMCSNLFCFKISRAYEEKIKKKIKYPNKEKC